jgi:uncharacterized membrane protein
MVSKPSWMSRRRLLRRIDPDRVKAAIGAAEKRTSGEIRVSISSFFWGDVHFAAVRAFERMQMHKTQLRNGVLLFVVPSRRRFVVLGDGGIHEKVGQAFWERVAGAISEHFRRGDFTAGIVHGIEVTGEQLASHFPYQEGADVNELPDDIDYGKR